MHPSRKVYEMRKSISTKNTGRQFSAALKGLISEQNSLQKKIMVIENRLRFGYSDPLYDYNMELIRADLHLSAKIMDELLRLHNEK